MRAVLFFSALITAGYSATEEGWAPCSTHGECGDGNFCGIECWTGGCQECEQHEECEVCQPCEECHWGSDSVDSSCAVCGGETGGGEGGHTDPSAGTAIKEGNGDMCEVITMIEGSFPGEVTWHLYGEDETSCGMPPGMAGYTEPITCCYNLGENVRLEMSDTYGDGWNGAEVEILGTAYTIGTGYERTELISWGGSANDGDDCADVHLYFGSFPSEIGATLSTDDHVCMLVASNDDFSNESVKSCCFDAGATVTIGMTDTYGDGWNGAEIWVLGEYYTLEDGYGGDATIESWGEGSRDFPGFSGGDGGGSGSGFWWGSGWGNDTNPGNFTHNDTVCHTSYVLPGDFPSEAYVIMEDIMGRSTCHSGYFSDVQYEEPLWEDAFTCCFPEGQIYIDLFDTYGDGWNGARLWVLGEEYTLEEGYAVSHIANWTAENVTFTGFKDDGDIPDGEDPCTYFHDDRPGLTSQERCLHREGCCYTGFDHCESCPANYTAPNVTSGDTCVDSYFYEGMFPSETAALLISRETPRECHLATFAPSNWENSHTCCFDDGEMLMLELIDSYGDGWNGALLWVAGETYTLGDGYSFGQIDLNWTADATFYDFSWNDMIVLGTPTNDTEPTPFPTPDFDQYCGDMTHMVKICGSGAGSLEEDCNTLMEIPEGMSCVFDFDACYMWNENYYEDYYGFGTYYVCARVDDDFDDTDEPTPSPTWTPTWSPTARGTADAATIEWCSGMTHMVKMCSGRNEDWEDCNSYLPIPANDTCTYDLEYDSCYMWNDNYADDYYNYGDYYMCIRLDADVPAPTPMPTESCEVACGEGTIWEDQMCTVDDAAGQECGIPAKARKTKKVDSSNVADSCACEIYCLFNPEATVWYYKKQSGKCECLTGKNNKKPQALLEDSNDFRLGFILRE